VEPNLQTLQSQRREDESVDAPHESRCDARDVLTRVLYEQLSGRIADELLWALG